MALFARVSVCVCFVYVPSFFFKASNKLKNNSKIFVKTRFEHFNTSKRARPYVVHMRMFVGLHVQINMNYPIITAICTFAVSFCVCVRACVGRGLMGLA